MAQYHKQEQSNQQRPPSPCRKSKKNKTRRANRRARRRHRWQRQRKMSSVASKTNAGAGTAHQVRGSVKKVRAAPRRTVAQQYAVTSAIAEDASDESGTVSRSREYEMYKNLTMMAFGRKGESFNECVKRLSEY